MYSCGFRPSANGGVGVLAGYPDPDPEHDNLVQDSRTFTYTTSNANKNNSENNIEILKLNGD